MAIKLIVISVGKLNQALTYSKSLLKTVENQPTNDQEVVDKIYDYAANLLLTEKRDPATVISLLEEQGLDKESATLVVNNLQSQIREAKKEAANKDMLYGALWCVGGLIATFANFGFVFWGAILFGGIQFIKGVINYTNNR